MPCLLVCLNFVSEHLLPRLTENLILGCCLVQNLTPHPGRGKGRVCLLSDAFNLKGYCTHSSLHFTSHGIHFATSSPIKHHARTAISPLDIPSLQSILSKLESSHKQKQSQL